MRTITLVCLLNSVVAVLATPEVLAYGREGHETTGAIAASRIAGTRAEKEVAKILKTGEDLSTATVWADCAKGFLYCHKQPTAEMKEYAKKNPDHHGYHYADISYQQGAYKATAVGANPADVVHILTQAIQVLQGKTDAAHNPHGFTQREALFLVAHLTGDIHQPLHVGAVYLDDNDEFVDPKSENDLKTGKVFETHGGNWLMLGSHNLHGLWDTDLVHRAMRREHATTPKEFADALLAKHYAKPTDHGDPATWPKKWADEAVKLSKTELEPVTPEERTEVEDHGGRHYTWTITLPHTYMPKGTVQVEKQLDLAGERLAEILKAVWP